MALLGRPAIAAVGVLGAAGGLLALAPAPQHPTQTLAALSRDGASPETGLVVLLAWVGWACLAWLAVALTASVLSHAPGAAGRTADRVAGWVSPALLRRAVEAALGLSVVAGTVGTAPAAYAEAPLRFESAAPVLGDVGPFDRPVTAQPHRPAGRAQAATPAPRATPTPPPSPVPAAVTSADPAGWFVVEVPAESRAPHPAAAGQPVRVPADRPESARRPAPAAPPSALLTGPAQPAGNDGEVVVRRGDTLWALAADRLGAQAAPSDIDAEWRRWYAANREVIGGDPDLIRPGQRLRVPTPSPSHPSSTAPTVTPRSHP